MTIVVGLTGGIGMGKSTVAKMLYDLKIPVFEADRYVHRLLNAHGMAVTPVAKAFPSSFDRTRKAINRTALGSAIFGSTAKRKKLESILHPLVRAAEHRFMIKHIRACTPLVILDIPLLFESGADAFCDAVMVVSAPANVRRARVMVRANMTEAKFQAIVAAQMKDSVRRKRADYVLDTGKSRAATKRDLQAILRAIKQTHARNCS